MIDGVEVHADGTATASKMIHCYGCLRPADFIAIYVYARKDMEWEPVCWLHTDDLKKEPTELLPIIKMSVGEERRVRELLDDAIEVYTEGPTGVASFKSARYR